MLYIFSGLPACGKSKLSQHFAKKISAIHLRIDAIEQALKTHSGMPAVLTEGYVAAYAVALDNLQLDHTVIADCVNPIPETRQAWRQIAAEAGTEVFEIEVICSDLEEHQRRYEARIADVPGLVYPPWQAVLDREYLPYPEARLQIDTSGKTLAESHAELAKGLGF